MDLRSIFGGVSIGRDTSGNVLPSIKGLAVKVADGTFVAKDGDGLLDVGNFVFEGAERYVFRLPVNEAQIEPGDLLIVSDNPFQALFVTAVKDGTIFGLSPHSSCAVEYVPHTNLLGLKLFVKVVSLLGDLSSAGAGDLLPMLLLGDSGSSMSGEGDSSLATLLLMQSLGGGAALDTNKLLPLLLLKGGKSDGMESLLLLQALGLNLGNLGAGASGRPEHGTGLPPAAKTAQAAGKSGRSEATEKA